MADYYTLLTDAGIAYETACKAAGVPIKLAHISVGDGNGAVYNPDASAKALKREVWRGPLNALFQDEKNASWLMAEVTIPSDVGGWYVREAGLWTDTGILYAIVKYPESYKPVLATSGSGKEFYIRSIFETSNASIVTLLIDDTVVKATRAWVMDYLKQGTYSKTEIEGLIAKASALPVGAILAFPVNEIPPGFLEIDGSVKSATVYPDLAAFLGGAFNKGDEGAGSFRLPETRGEFLRGWDHGRGVDAGRGVGSYQSDTLQNIVGNVAADPAAAYQFLGEGNLTATGAFGVTYRTASGINDASTVQMGASLNFDASRSVRTSTETRGRNLAVMWCIKAWNSPINQGNIDIAAIASLASQATETSQGTAKVATSAQMDAGIDDTTIATPKKLRLGFSVSLTTNGYVSFPSWLGGIVLQWGYVPGSLDDLTALISFPLPFP
ncbi:phage tail protein, partial [Pseudomonas kairouanensis]|uniref:phage tail-collar fiber domain-containing protein n=1 Tax=Pseudomonas kairouanensis TaxID=2293832 RepID=UPI001EE341DF